jgi:hypothetical protein
MIRLLTSVDVTGLQPQTLLAVRIAEAVWNRHGADTLWITSAADGAHKEDSLHYEGLAVDLRVRNLPQSSWETVTAELQAALGRQYDVILETDPAKGPHVHVEFDPVTV